MNKRRYLIMVGIVVAAVLLLATSCTTPTNSQPIIISLEAESEKVIPLGNCQITCNATDPDGDELSCKWSVNGGKISGTGAVVNWTAPEEIGTYYIKVVVTDSHGSSATKTLPISVMTVQPPNIEDLLVTADHCYLLAYSWGYKVGKGQKYDIECIASNTSGELTYDWSCDGGEISGEGSIITWTAPNPIGSADITVTVIVSDIVGNVVSESVLLQVVACSPCTFGC